MTALAADPAPAHGRRIRSLVFLSLTFIAGAALLWWMVVPDNPFRDAPVMGTLLSWLLLVPAVKLLRHVTRRRVSAIVLAGTVLLGLVAASSPPRTSNDSARYAWDGIVQKAGISPYAFVPVDETISELRPAWLFAPGTLDDNGNPTCSKSLFGTESIAATGFPSGEALCTAINRPHVPTIYPPTAELYFLGVRATVPDNVAFLPFQLGGLVISVAVTLLLLRTLSRLGLPLHLAAAWAWSPFVMLEAVNNAHVDVLAGALILAAGLLLIRGKPLTSGAAFGAAVATKLIPVIAAPALLFHRPARFITSAIATFVLLYVPYIAIAGYGVLGFLPGYLKEEGYSQSDGIRFGLAQLVSTGPWPAVISAGALAMIAVVVLSRSQASTLWENQTVMIGLTLLIVSPNYPWYALMLLPFIVLSRRWEYVAVIIALDVIYMVPKSEALSDTINQSVLLGALAAVAIGAWLRCRQNLHDSAVTALLAENETASPLIDKG